VATADHLAAVPEEQRRSLLAAVATLHIAGQHRRAATRTVAENDIDLDLATTLVMLERERIRRVVTFDARFDAYDVELVGGHTFSS
jgi:predicted nucleic acid-binding protein